MIVETLYKGTSIIKGDEQSKQEKLLKKILLKL